MRTSDWASILSPKILLVGENSTLQWKDEIIEYVMFLDYYFRPKPYDLGERSRYSEAKTIFDYLKEITGGICRPEQLYGTILSNDIHQRPPKGKHIFIPDRSAQNGVMHIKRLLTEHPTIEYVFVIGLQTNYYLQKYKLYSCGDTLTEKFIKGAEPRRAGVSSVEPYYQPVDAKPFRDICYNMYNINGFEKVKIVPILPVKYYPLKDTELKNFGENFERLKDYFKKLE